MSKTQIDMDLEKMERFCYSIGDQCMEYFKKNSPTKAQAFVFSGYIDHLRDTIIQSMEQMDVV